VRYCQKHAYKMQTTLPSIAACSIRSYTKILMGRSLPKLSSTKRLVGRHKNIISLFQEKLMKSRTRAAAVTAVKWALGLSAGFILGPIVIALTSGTEISGKLIAQKLVVGIVWFPILFFGLWIWGALSKKDPITGSDVEMDKKKSDVPKAIQETDIHGDSTQRKPKKWNYIGIGVGAFMLLFLFLPQIINGTLSNIYYLGAAFWVGVIIYCSLNILRARQ
jgi:hypothetical protein